jgi:hypothetical protein
MTAITLSPLNAGRPVAEVDHARAVRAEQDVGGLEVAVHHPRAVDRGQRGGRAHGQPLQLALGQRAPVVDAFLKGRAVDELADDVAALALGRGLDDAGGDERLDGVDRVELTGQPLQDRGVRRGPQHLDRDALLARAGATAQVDDALAALAEPTQQLEPAQGLGIAGLQRFRRHEYSGIGR